MKTAFSCVVDGSPKFEWQAVNLCLSLLRNAGVQADDIKVHVTPQVSIDFREFVLDHGLCLVAIDAFPGNHGYCNKIQQMFSAAFSNYERAVLCDCDLYFLRPLDLDNLGAPAAGRVVDRPNPPLPLLKELYRRHGVSPSAEISVGFPDSEDELTIASNWNGGLYVFDARQMGHWGRVWAAHAVSLLSDLVFLGRHRTHVDQISLALTIDELAIAYQHLPPEDNYPIHLDKLDAYRQAPASITSLHCHHKVDSLGKLIPTGAAALDVQIESANRLNGVILTNRILRNENIYRIFQGWQASTDAATQHSVAASLSAFHNPRYLRHNARRLEHLASLNLDISRKTVLEFGAGIGDHSLFFLDRGCTVTSIEPRRENIQCILSRQNSESAFCRYRHKVIRCTTDEAFAFVHDMRFQIVYNYGLLYHLGEPEQFLRQSAAYCEGLYLLETAVSDLTGADQEYREDTKELSNSVDGVCHLLSRERIFSILHECLPHVYMPVTQPAHEQFLRDWVSAPTPRLNRHRAVFIGSTSPLQNPMLAEKVLMQHVE